MGKKNNNGNGNDNSNGTTRTSYKQQQSDDRKDYSSLKTVLFYCSLIVFLPIITFFIFKGYLLEYLFNITELQKSIFSAFSAVIALHGALGLFVYRAYFSGTPHNKAD